jgi:hypothetical protein
MLLDFTAYRETAAVAPFQLTVPSPSAIAWLRDRAGGLVVAFDPRHPLSYFASFQTNVLLLPLALAAFALAGRERSGAPDGLGPRAARSAVVVATALAGLGSLAGVHALHATYVWEWWFHWRHGLPLVFLLALALAVAWASGARWARLVASAVVVIAALQGAFAIARALGDPRYAPGGPSVEERALVAWIDGAPDPPTLLTTRPQALAAWSARGRFHWLDCAEDRAQTESLLRALPIDGVVVYPGEAACPALRGGATSVGTRLFNAGELAVWAPWK